MNMYLAMVFFETAYPSPVESYSFAEANDSVHYLAESPLDALLSLKRWWNYQHEKNSPRYQKIIRVIIYNFSPHKIQETGQLDSPIPMYNTDSLFDWDIKNSDKISFEKFCEVENGKQK